MKEGYGAGLLMREKDGKYYAATGSKGYRWMESEMVKELGKEDGHKPFKIAILRNSLHSFINKLVIIRMVDSVLFSKLFNHFRHHI